FLEKIEKRQYKVSCPSAEIEKTRQLIKYFTHSAPYFVKLLSVWRPFSRRTAWMYVTVISRSSRSLRTSPDAIRALRYDDSRAQVANRGLTPSLIPGDNAQPIRGIVSRPQVLDLAGFEAD